MGKNTNSVNPASSIHPPPSIPNGREQADGLFSQFLQNSTALPETPLGEKQWCLADVLAACEGKEDHVPILLEMFPNFDPSFDVDAAFGEFISQDQDFMNLLKQNP